MNPQFFVVPITHVDLAWKRGREEMSEMLEIVIVRVLDLLEQEPDLKFHLEQAAHFRHLQKRRPDLIERLQPFIENKRLEFVGAMASTLETNLPNGECFIRNQQMGLRWARETWGAEIETAWLVDTFGICAQTPQILRGFGFRQLMANRFGGNHTQDLFQMRGLDGTEIRVAGWGTYASGMKHQNVCERFCANWDHVAELFQRADNLSGLGPFLIIAYTENENLISRRAHQLTQSRDQERADQNWQFATPRDFFHSLEETIEKSGRVLPVVEGDLNPEFTGCFSLRPSIRLRNRAVETRLLEAEKWAAFAAWSTPGLEDAWWQLHFVQFHDVLSGSHPTVIFQEVMEIFNDIEAAANAVLQSACARLAHRECSRLEYSRPGASSLSFFAFNGLPWARRDIARVLLPPEFAGVSRVIGENGGELPFEMRDELLQIETEIPAVGWTNFSIEPGPENIPDWRQVSSATLENESLRMDFDCENGVAKLEWKPTKKPLMRNAGNWLVAQHDIGNFQIENPCGAEVSASSGGVKLEILPASDLGQSVRLSGEFPILSWAGENSFLRYESEWFLARHRAEVRLKIKLDWRGEATRIRLALPTTLDTSTGIFEIPFGVVSRKPYSPRVNAKGEWPAHRFVAIESDGHGIALVNTGAAGVEVVGGRVSTTLLRAPFSVYAGMEPDESSSQHGQHEFHTAIVPFSGSWIEAGVIGFAQEMNSPILVHAGANASTPARCTPAGSTPGASLLQLEPANIVLSSVKSAHDKSGDLIARVYETAGRATDAVLKVSLARKVWLCDLMENTGDEIPLENGVLCVALSPFEIKTFRIQITQ